MNSTIARHVVRMLSHTKEQKFVPDDGTATAGEIIAAQLVAKAIGGDTAAAVSIVAIERDYDPILAEADHGE